MDDIHKSVQRPDMDALEIGVQTVVCGRGTFFRFDCTRGKEMGKEKKKKEKRNDLLVIPFFLHTYSLHVYNFSIVDRICL